jgi:hypothetical protein
MRLGYVGCVEEGNISDLDSHADCCVCGKEVLVFNDFDQEVMVTGWDTEGETKSLRIVPAALGYTIPETGKNVLLISHQRIFSPTLNHNLISTMQMRLHDVVVNEIPTFQCFRPTNLSHSISVRGDNVDDISVIPLDFLGVVYCFPTFKLSQEEFETCERYELMYETPEYDPYAKTFHEQEAGQTHGANSILQGNSIPSGAKFSHSSRRRLIQNCSAPDTVTPLQSYRTFHQSWMMGPY